MKSLEELSVSRRNWIETVLIPWCRGAERRDLIHAEIDWINLAGGVDPKLTLWVWAWSRFPVVTHEGLPGLNETNEVCVTVSSGELITGFPDNTASHRGHLVLLTRSGNHFAHHSPISIDDILSIHLVDPSSAATTDLLSDRPLTMMPQFSSPDERI